MDNDSNSNFRYARSDIISKIIIYCRKTQKTDECKTELGFNPISLIIPRKGSMTTIIMKSSPGVKMIEQYFILGKSVNLYLPDHKLAIEVNEKGNIDRKKEKEEEIKHETEKELKFIRINLDSEKFNIGVEIGQTYNHIDESNKKLTQELTKKIFLVNSSVLQLY